MAASSDPQSVLPGRPRRRERRLSRALSLVFVSMCVSGAAPAPAADSPYPARTVRVIVPYPPGGGNDIIGRATADELGRRTGQQFFVDNRGGASTTIGAEMAARAAPDGYTLIVSSGTTFAIVPNLKAKVPYDALKDFEPITMLATQPYLIVAHPSLPVRSVKELVALAKSKPGQIIYASPTLGSGGHLSAELFKLATHTDLMHVPYKGGGPAITDLLGGHVQLMFATFSSVVPLAASGRLRPIAVTSLKRSPALPGTPTVAESVPGFETSQWNAIFGPRGMPRPAVDRLNAEWSAAVKAPALRERLASQGYEPASSTPQQLGEYVKVEFARYAKLIRTIGLKDE
jgi:tripartite-type tricarboxylate transporter receptor subunit TctC